MHKKSVQKYSGSLKQAASRVADETLYDVDHETLNEAVAEHLKQAFEATEIRVEELAAEVPDGPIPYKVELPHTDCPVTTHRAVSFTGTRFINVFTLSASATEPSRSTKRARATLSVTRDTADEGHLDPEAPEARGIVLLAEIMNGKARTQLNCQAVVDLVAATAYSQATPLFEMLPDYLAPMLQNVHMRQVSRLMCASMQLLIEIQAAAGLLCSMVDCVVNRIAGFAKDDCDRAATDFQHMLEYDAAASASVRNCMIQCLLLDPPMHGLAYACAAAAHCDGACASESVAAIVAGVQPGADTFRVRWLLDTMALGAPGRRFALAARLQANESSECCSAPRCTIESKNSVGSGEGLMIRTHTASELLPYASGSLKITFGVVRASADALAALAAAAGKWVTERSEDGWRRSTPMLGDGTGWKMRKEKSVAAASLEGSACGGVPLAWLRKVAKELGYSNFGEAWGEPIWVCVCGQEIPDNEVEQA